MQSYLQVVLILLTVGPSFPTLLLSLSLRLLYLACLFQIGEFYFLDAFSFEFYLPHPISFRKCRLFIYRFQGTSHGVIDFEDSVA